MFKKKRPSASRHKQRTPPPLSAAAYQPSPSQLPTPAAVEPVPESEIKQAISRALTEMKLGVREKALEFIKESVSRYPLSGHLHHVEAMIHLRLADHAEDESDQQVEHLEDGILSAKLAVDFLPKSIHSAALLADLYFQLAFVDQEWVGVIELCMQALEMENPDDSGIAELFGEDATDESVIEEAKDTILMLLSDSKRKIREFAEKKLAEEANVDVEDDDSEEKKDNRVDIERVVVVMDRRKKQFKAITRVCGALKQKMIDTSKKLNGDIETIVEYLRFWNVSLSVETKRGFQKVNIKELVKHLKALDCQLVVDHLLEAIDFAKEEQTLQFWECYVCVKKFGDYDSYRQHFWEVHWVDNAWKLASDLGISKKSVDIITNCAWKPVDIDEARKMFDRKSESCSTSKTSADNPKWIFCNDAQRAGLLAKIRGMFDLLLKNNCLASSHINFVIEYTKDQFEGTIPMSLYRNHHGLETLQIISCLNVSQLTEFLEFLAGVVRNCGLGEDAEIDSSMEYNQSDKFFAVRIDFNKDCSCFLWQELQGEPDDKFDAAVEDDGSAIMLPLERESSVFFDGNDHIVSWLHVGSNCVEILESWTGLIYFQRLQARKFLQMFDEELLHVSKLCDGHIKISSMLNAVQVIGSLIVEEINKREKSPRDYQPQHLLDLLRTRRRAIQDNIDDISVRTELEVISSILEGSLVILRRDQSGSEARSEEEEWKQADDAIKFVMRRSKMQMLLDMAYLDAIVLRIVVALGQYERELASISVYDYRSIIVPMIKSFVQPRLKDMYEDAQEKSKAAAEALLADSDNVKQKKDKKKKKKKNKNPKKAKESELSLLDAIALRIIGALGQYEWDLASISVYDYRSIIVPMMKSFLQPLLKDLYEDAKEKSKVSEETLLAGMALEETEKKINKDSDNVKQKQDKKKKKKKKKKNPKKAKESEGTNDSKHFDLHQKGAEQDDNPNSKSNDSLGELKQLTVSDEERMLAKYLENQRQFEHEASVKVNASGSRHEKLLSDSASVDVSESMLEEPSKYQRQIDNNETKQKCIAEKPTNIGETFGGNAVEGVSDFSPERLLGDSVSVDVSENSSAIEERTLEEPSEYRRQIDNEAKQKCIAEKPKNIGETIGGNAVEGVSDFSLERLLGDSVSVDVSENSSAIEERKLEEPSEYQRQIDNEPKQKCIAEKPKNIGETIGGNAEESVSDYSSESNHEECEKRFLCDIEKTICLSLDCFEKCYGTLLPTDVNNSKTSRLDSQWYLRQIRDEFMNIVPNKTHTHAGDPCFRCAYSDTFSARRIASRDMPEEVVQLSSRKLYPVGDYFEEWLDKENPVNKVIDISSSACQLKQQLVDVVRKIVVDLEHERQINNDDTEKDFAEQNTV